MSEARLTHKGLDFLSIGIAFVIKPFHICRVTGQRTDAAGIIRRDDQHFPLPCRLLSVP